VLDDYQSIEGERTLEIQIYVDPRKTKNQKLRGKSPQTSSAQQEDSAWLKQKKTHGKGNSQTIKSKECRNFSDDDKADYITRPSVIPSFDKAYSTNTSAMSF
jgi:hypothetical protein